MTLSVQNAIQQCNQALHHQDIYCGINSPVFSYSGKKVPLTYIQIGSLSPTHLDLEIALGGNQTIRVSLSGVHGQIDPTGRDLELRGTFGAGPNDSVTVHLKDWTLHVNGMVAPAYIHF